MPKRKICVLSFTCPSSRKKGGKDSLCHGFMAAQTINSQKGSFLCYCSKCGTFYLAIPKNDIYELTLVDKNDISFIAQPYILNGEVI